MIDSNTSLTVYVVAGTYNEFLEWKETVKSLNRHVFVSSIERLYGLRKVPVWFVGSYEKRADFLDLKELCVLRENRVAYLNYPKENATTDLKNQFFREVERERQANRAIEDKEAKNRFDFEQEIMDVWNITADFDALIESWESLSDKKKLAIVTGLRELYDCKMEIMFKTFESLVSEKELD